MKPSPRFAPLLVFLLTTTAFGALPPIKGSRAVFEISPSIVVSDPPRFGANLEAPNMSHWNTEPWHNQWFNAPNPNPVSARVKGTATGGSETTLENSAGPKLAFWSVFLNGFFDGGSVVVYRMDEGKVSVVREGKIAKFEPASADGKAVLTFTEPGPAVQAGDEYVLTTVRTDFPAGVTRTWSQNPWWLVAGLALEGGKEKALYDAGVRLALSSDAPPGGGAASLALTVPENWENGRVVSVGNTLISGEQPDWPRFHEGKTYTARLWMKTSDPQGATVTVKAASMGKADFDVTPEWKEFSFEFTGAPPLTNRGERFEIGMSQPGTLLIDNITLTENDGPPPFGFYPQIVETLKRFSPGSLRLWVLQDNSGFGKCLDDALGDPLQSNMVFATASGANSSAAVGLHRLLELCEKVGTDPWIITSTMFSAQEQQNLIEFLAGPADSPYGKKRAALGREKPWTEAFHRIKIEMGNETWNPAFIPQGFSHGGAFYGAYSEFMFEKMKSSPWFQPEKFQFVLNGWIAQTGLQGWAYGASALRNSPSAGAVDIAYYTGGWDAVGLLKADSPEEGWMNILTYARRMLVQKAKEFKETADTIAQEQGRPGGIQSLVYEAGPGYTLPGPGKFNLAEQQEGKSLAQAINSLDVFMSNLRDGYGDQEFFMFKNGHYWSSHNRTWGEHIAWKALGMRNSLLQGDLVTATPKEMVTMDLPETQADVISQSNSANKAVKSFPPVPDLPLIDCYPFKQGNHFSTMLISRRLDGATPVTLEFPKDMQPKYTLHTLGGDSPAAHNIDTEAVKVVTEEKEGMKKTFTLNVPPHAVVVVVGESKP